MATNNSTIRASEIGNYLYCQRSWSYQRQGMESSNMEELRRGTTAHSRHGRQVRGSMRLRAMAFAILLIAAFILVTELIA